MTENIYLDFVRFPHPDSRLYMMFLKAPDAVMKVIKKLEDPRADYNSAAFTYFDYDRSIMHFEMNIIVKGIHGLAEASVKFIQDDISTSPDAIDYSITTDTFHPN